MNLHGIRWTIVGMTDLQANSNISAAIVRKPVTGRVPHSKLVSFSRGGGYIFSTSNCIYTGMRLSRYEQMLDVWPREGNY